MRKYRKHLFGALALVLAAAVAGCGASKGGSSTSASATATGSAKHYAELRWGLGAFAGPIYFRNNLIEEDGYVSGLTLQGLVEFEPSGKLKLGLASSVEHPNPRTYIYNIRSGVRFSDGKPLTVADVLYSLRRNLVGKLAETKLGWEEAVSSISARGDSAVIVKLKRIDSAWPALFGYSDQIIEKADAERVGEKALGTAGAPVIGTGPWKIESYKPEASVQLSRNPYWSGPPQPAEKITIEEFKSEAAIALALRSGAIDGTFGYSSPKNFEAIPGTRQLTSPGASLFLFSMNTQSPPLSDVHVRRAIAYASNVEGMIKALYPSVGGISEISAPLPPDVFANLGSPAQVKAMLATLPKYTFNLAAAKRELAKSTACPHGCTVRFQTAGIGNTNEDLIAQILSSDLAKIGITAKVEELPPSGFSGLVAGKVTSFITGYYPVYDDPQSILAEVLPSKEIAPGGSGYNFAKYKNPEVDKLLSAETETVSATERLHILGKLLRIVGTEEPYRSLFTYPLFAALSEKYVFPTFSPWTAIFTPWALDVKLAQ